MRTIPYILATAGHVDHGKSSLVLALTGTDPNRLPEEKRRGVTIDLGFAHLRLEALPDTNPDIAFDVGLIDVPGHEDFIRNMVAGVGAIDAALLVVAADDGWMPQTEEHLRILAYLGVTRAIIALTKVDLVDNVVDAAVAIRGRLKGTPFADAAIVPVSVRGGRGIDALRDAFTRLFSGLHPQRDAGKPRVAVDRAFQLRGIGTVVTGTLTGGALSRGQELIVRPAGESVRLRGLQAYHKDVATAAPGSRVALNLPDLAAADRHAAAGGKTISRGDLITLAAVGGSTRRADALLLPTLSTAADEGNRLGPPSFPPIRAGQRVRFHHGASAIAARVRILDDASGDGGRGPLLRLLLDRPTCLLVGDRFILRDAAERRTLGGGIVLDPNPPASARRRPAHLRLLRDRASAPFDADRFVGSAVARDGVASLKDLYAVCHFSAAELDAAVDRLADSVVTVGEAVVDAALVKRLEAIAQRQVETFHQEHPERGGLPLVDLRRTIHEAMTKIPIPPSEAAATAVIDALVRDGYRRTDSTIALGTHRPALPARMRAAGERIRQALGARPLDPPSRKELIVDDLAFRAMKFLIASGEVIEAGPDIVVSAAAYRSAVDIVRRHIQSRGPSTVTDLKAALASNRRVTVPLLEKLDRDGITRRQGDLRVLRA